MGNIFFPLIYLFIVTFVAARREQPFPAVQIVSPNDLIRSPPFDFKPWKIDSEKKRTPNLYSLVSGERSCTDPLQAEKGYRCLSTADCDANLECSTATKTCDYSLPGSACHIDSDCTGLYAFCINGVCDSMRGPGSPCTSNAQCFSNGCVNGTCLAKPLGSPCNPSQCAVGSFCDPTQNGGTCVESLPLGSNCSAQIGLMLYGTNSYADINGLCADSVCDYYGINGGVSGICQPIFPAFAPSSSYACGAFGYMTCGSGMICQMNSTPFPSGSGSCRPSSGSCGTDNTQCDIFSLCECYNTTSGTCKVDTCKVQHMQKYYTCLLDNKCGILNPNIIPGSCESKCISHFTDYHCCAGVLHVDHAVPAGVACNCTSSSSSTPLPFYGQPCAELGCLGILECLTVVEPNLCWFSNFGSSCLNDVYCVGIYTDCIEGKCGVRRGPGDACSSPQDCFSLNCTSGHCGMRMGPISIPCNGSDCELGKYCNPITRQCVPALTLGSNCGTEYNLASSNPAFTIDALSLCENGICDFYWNQGTPAGICKPLFTGAEGDQCALHGSFTCGLNYSCTTHSPSVGYCTKFQECDNARPCRADIPYNCVCNTTYGTGTCQRDSCAAEYLPAYYNCLLSHRCGLYDGTTTLSNTCASQCALEFYAYHGCMHAKDSNYLLPPGYQEVTSNSSPESSVRSSDSTGGQDSSSFLEAVPDNNVTYQPPTGKQYSTGFVVSLIILGSGIIGLAISAFGICYLRLKPKSLLVFKESELATMLASSS